MRESLQLLREGPVARLRLDRPQLHNAFDAGLIAGLTDVLEELGRDATTRVVVLEGAGASFSAGADLNWMRGMAAAGEAENREDSLRLAKLMRTLDELPKPTIARVHGAAFGGGVGLVACCDIAIATQDATFALSEGKLGLIPATIGPYVVEAIGARHARRYMLTAEKFDAAEAYRIGLVHDIVPDVESLDARVNELLGSLLLAGPHAQKAVKALIRAVAHRPIDERVIADTAERIATIRASDEGREGIGAFLTRRSPEWVPESLRKKK